MTCPIRPLLSKKRKSGLGIVITTCDCFLIVSGAGSYSGLVLSSSAVSLSSGVDS
eukprot:CAMPEP_0168821164 /NCGR_PEP_ID=MMETSP0726-20121227/9256_1 /TAXON_ID=265536 /ORGANISM="Amphiprora sp., Strain CCMP467" /LENGTH=54 /DNA_ID=CAMNT_0008873763 /DNA_START=61 /DNA_END=222 /DNA_ORIENTATION=-